MQFHSLTLSLMLLVIGLVFSTVVNSAASDTQTNSEYENIIVESKVPLLYYKKQFEMAELDFYELYNSLADEPKFKMVCNKRRVTGSHIKRTFCYPQFWLNQSAQASQEAFSNTDTNLLRQGIVKNPPSVDTIEFLSTRDRKAALVYVEKLVKAHPKLYQQLLKMAQAEQVYLAKKQARKTRTNTHTEVHTQ